MIFSDKDTKQIEAWAGMPLVLLYREFEIIKELKEKQEKNNGS